MWKWERKKLYKSWAILIDLPTAHSLTTNNHAEPSRAEPNRLAKLLCLCMNHEAHNKLLNMSIHMLSGSPFFIFFWFSCVFCLSSSQSLLHCTHTEWMCACDRYEYGLLNISCLPNILSDRRFILWMASFTE